MLKTRILIADPQRASASFPGESLPDCDCLALETRDPQEILRVIRSQRPRIVFLDILFAERVRTSLQSMPIDIIVISTRYIPLEKKIELFQSGVAGCLRKPLSRPTILRVVKTVLTIPEKRTNLPKVLIVDDDESVRDYLDARFESEGFTPHTTDSGETALFLAGKLKPDVIVLDLGLEDLDGMEVMQILKSNFKTSTIPIAVLTGRKQNGQEAVCMTNGADTYLIKGVHDLKVVPLHARKLLERNVSSHRNVLTAGLITLNLKEGKAYVAGQLIGLTHKEFDLLAYLIVHSPHPTPWEAIEKDIWAWDSRLLASKAPETIKVHYSHLRSKLGPKVASYFCTFRGLGIQFRTN